MRFREKAKPSRVSPQSHPVPTPPPAPSADQRQHRARSNPPKVPPILGPPLAANPPRRALPVLVVSVTKHQTYQAVEPLNIRLIHNKPTSTKCMNESRSTL
ncbi:hypothetical protein CCHR01_08225 [Colletotrichum chrysophilum]|uniref:Uncharacterized protein n=1 Tax=Colletotrichum chrysophilum TaxID=1836956 RepID=A0AAD9AIR3_9PEZI|nr:hypothetical protein CCHR01_08225 [Colletotrichum chrysophilum]